MTSPELRFQPLPHIEVVTRTIDHHAQTEAAARIFTGDRGVDQQLLGRVLSTMNGDLPEGGRPTQMHMLLEPEHGETTYIAASYPGESLHGLRAVGYTLTKNREGEGQIESMRIINDLSTFLTAIRESRLTVGVYVQAAPKTERPTEVSLGTCDMLLGAKAAAETYALTARRLTGHIGETSVTAARELLNTHPALRTVFPHNELS